MNRRSDRVWRGGFAVAVVLGACACLSLAQEQGGVRTYDEQLRVQLDRQLPSAREVGPDGGGWLSFAFFNYDDDVARKERTLRQFQIRGWGSFDYHREHKFYVRGLLGWDDWNSGTNPKSYRGDEFTGLEIERAWYRFDLGEMLRNRTGQEPPAGFSVKVGREFATIGTELVLSMPLDMVQVQASVGDWELMALLGKTIYHTPNIDDSPAVHTHQRRCFWGTQVTYKGFSQHRPFAYFLSNRDRTQPQPVDPFQSYDYSTDYIGAGSQGTLLLPDLRYQVEVVGEVGKTYSSRERYGQDDVCAMAADARLQYFFRCPTRPQITYEQLWASGDKDRQLSATSTVLGNEPGTKDNAFNAFGYRDIGLAFSPRLSNLHVYNLGASFYPLERLKACKDLEVGSKVFLYQKSEPRGPLSDSTASDDSRWVGWEWDVYANWRLTSDLSWTIRYGAFMPGSAFENDATRHFVLTAVLLSF